MISIKHSGTVIVLAAFSVVATEFEPVPLTSNDVASVQQVLEATPEYEIDNTALHNSDLRRKVISYYLMHPKSLSAKAEMRIAAAYSGEGHFDEAMALGRDLLKAYPNNWQAQFLIGYCQLKIGSPRRAVHMLTNALANASGSNLPYATAIITPGLAEAAILTDDFHVMEMIAPDLVSLAQSRTESDEAQRRIALWLMVYAIGCHNEGLFVDAVGTVRLEELTRDLDLRTYAQLGCQVFSTNALILVRVGLRNSAKLEVPSPGAKESVPITEEDIQIVQTQLAQCAEGKLDLYESITPEACRRLIAYYQSGRHSVPAKAKLALSRCLGRERQYRDAFKVATEYAGVYSNDWRAWRMIGIASCMLGAYDGAVESLQKARHLGDKGEDSVKALAYSAMMSGRLQVMGSLAPELLEREHTAGDSSGLAFKLVWYAISTNDRNLYLKAMRGVNAQQVCSDDALKIGFFMGYHFFSAKELEPIVRDVRKLSD